MASNQNTEPRKSTVSDQSPVFNDQHDSTSPFYDTSPEESPYQLRRTDSESANSGSPISEEQNARLADFVSKYGYRLFKENGQRKFCAPPEWNLPTPPRGSEVFVGKLPRDIYEDELVPLFERCGRIYEMRLMMDFSGTNRGYAFVTYTNREDARRACNELNNYEIRRGRHIGVVVSVDNCRLFVGGIPRTRSREEVKAEMSKLTDGVVDVILYPSAADKTKNRGFAFVEYESHRAAAKARRKLIPNRIQLWGNVIAVDWAEPEQDVDETTMSNVKVLYVRNLMVNTTEDTLRHVFENAAGTVGSVERVKKMRDFAFVHFNTREQALRAREQLNGMEVDGATVEVVLSKPPYQSNIVRCMKNLQKTTGGRASSVNAGNDDYVAAAMRQVYAASNLLTSPTAQLPSSTALIDPVTFQAQQQLLNGQQAPVAAALTGFPFIDLYSNSQGLFERQNSMASQTGSVGSMKQIGNGTLPASNTVPLLGTRVNRGAAGMRSAGFQAMINNTMRHSASSRRKVSEQFLYDCIIGQQQASLHQQQLMAHQQAMMNSPGVFLIPSGPPSVPYFRSTVTSAAGFVPISPTTPYTVTLQQSSPGSGTLTVSTESSPVSAPASVSAPITTVANATEQSTSPIVQQSQIQNSAPILSAPQFLCFGNTTTAPFTSYQQHLEDHCREHGLGVPQYERVDYRCYPKDGHGNEVVLYNYKVIIPALASQIPAFQFQKFWPSENEAREAAAQFVCAQLGLIIAPNPTIMNPSLEMFGIQSPTTPWIIPDMNSFLTFNPLYQQQIRRPINQQLNVSAVISPPPASANA